MSAELNATRDALRLIAEAGSDLSRPLEMDFFVAVPDEASGIAVAAQADRLGFRTSVEQGSETGWTCYCTRNIVPSFAAVVAIERELDALAREYGGHADGFGTFGNAESADQDR